VSLISLAADLRESTGIPCFTAANTRRECQRPRGIDRSNFTADVHPVWADTRDFNEACATENFHLASKQGEAKSLPLSTCSAIHLMGMELGASENWSGNMLCSFVGLVQRIPSLHRHLQGTLQIMGESLAPLPLSVRRWSGNLCITLYASAALTSNSKIEGNGDCCIHILFFYNLRWHLRLFDLAPTSHGSFPAGSMCSLGRLDCGPRRQARQPSFR
jgi:hypothetical protein